MTVSTLAAHLGLGAPPGRLAEQAGAPREAVHGHLRAGPEADPVADRGQRGALLRLVEEPAAHRRPARTGSGEHLEDAARGGGHARRLDRLAERRALSFEEGTVTELFERDGGETIEDRIHGSASSGG
jgi:hypothetical protein